MANAMNGMGGSGGISNKVSNKVVGGVGNTRHVQFLLLGTPSPQSEGVK